VARTVRRADLAPLEAKRTVTCPPQECAKVGISGRGNIQAELLALGAEVPQLCAAVVEAVQAELIGAAIQWVTPRAHGWCLGGAWVVLGWCTEALGATLRVMPLLLLLLLLLLLAAAAPCRAVLLLLNGWLVQDLAVNTSQHAT